MYITHLLKKKKKKWKDKRCKYFLGSFGVIIQMQSHKLVLYFLLCLFFVKHTFYIRKKLRYSKKPLIQNLLQCSLNKNAAWMSQTDSRMLAFYSHLWWRPRSLQLSVSIMVTWISEAWSVSRKEMVWMATPYQLSKWLLSWVTR